MDSEEIKPKGFTRTTLPWVVALIALLVYGVTLNQWVSFNSLGPTTLALGIDWWGYRIGYPLFYAVADIVRLLPPSTQIVALNFISAICASLALALLVRTVAILPQDQTNDQRIRNADPHALLNTPTDWLPPVFAVFVCGFQLTFWEHATVATGEMINLLLFAYVIRCLAEHRLSDSDIWLYRAVFVYGLGIATNWAMVGFLPVFGFALLWIKKLKLFQPRFLLRALGLGLVGMLLYLYDPICAALDKAETKTFWEIMTFEFVSQRNPLLGMPKGRVIMLSITSIIPLLLISVKWPANFGDVSGSGVALAGFLVRMVHIVFLAAIVWVSFDPVFSPRKLGYGLPLMTFYYLGALTAGYLAGYFLLSCGVEPVRRWQRAGGLGKFINRILLLGVWVTVLAVPVLLLRQNLPAIRVENGELLKRFAEQVSKELPEQKVMLIGDNPRRLALVGAHFHEAGKGHLLVPMASMHEPRTHVRAAAKYPDNWPSPGDVKDAKHATATAIVRFLGGMSGGFPLWRVDTGYGSLLMESAYPKSRGLVYELKQYPPNQLAAPADPDAGEVLTEEFAVLSALRPSLGEDLATRSVSAKALAQIYSGWANGLGVRLQRAGEYTNAYESFAAAMEFNTNNVCASINLDVSDALLKGEPGISDNIDQLEQGMVELRSLGNVLHTHGPIDESTVRAYFGVILKNAKMRRQAIHEFARAVELNATNFAARFRMAETFLEVRLIDESERVLREAKELAATNTPAGFPSEFERMTALLEFSRGKAEAAERRLKAALEHDESNVELLQALVSVYIDTQRFEEALPVLEKQLEIAPKHSLARFNLGPVYTRLGRHDDAIKVLSELLEEQTNNAALLVNRALAYRGLNQSTDAQADYEGALEIDPAFRQAYVGLADLSEQAGDASKAQSWLQIAKRLTPPNSRDAMQIEARLSALAGATNSAPKNIPPATNK